MEGSCRGGLAVCSALGMTACFAPEIAVGLPCFEGMCPSGQVCDTAADVCVLDSSLGTWRDDTALDFTDPSATLEDATIEPGGAIAPTPYFVEGYAVLGIASLAIGTGNEAIVAWDAIAALPTTGRGFARGLQRGIDLAFSSTDPLPGTGLAASIGVSVRIEGEIFLDAGTTELELDVDNRGVFELGDPITGAYTRVVAGNLSADSVGSATVATAGWFPFRGAFENEAASSHYEVRTRTAANPSFADIPADRLRVRVDRLTGLALDGFDEPYLLDHEGTTLAIDSLAALAFGPGFPADVGDLGTVAWSTRWSGQVLVTAPGSYAFHLDSQGGHRMWLDGVQIADSNSGVAQQTTTAPTDLDTGWHDLVVDLIKDATSSTPSHLQLTIASGPELAGAFFPLDRTRPVHGRGARWINDDTTTDVAIPDAGAAAAANVMTVPGVALITDYLYYINHPVLASLGVSLALPGSTTTLVTPGALSGAGDYWEHVRFDGIDPDGTWTVTVTDTLGDAMTGMITAARLGATYAGGPAPFPTRSVYTSRVRDLQASIVSFGGVRWQARQERGGNRVIVRIRSCDAATACAAEPWREVAASGDGAGVPARSFVQYQVELATDGDVPTALDWIEIDYRLPGD